MVAFPTDGPYYPEPLIRAASNSIVKRYGLSPSDRPDIEQYIRFRITQGWQSYDPTKSQPNTFADRIVSRAAATFLRDRYRDKRDPRREAGTVDDYQDQLGTDRHYDDRVILEMDMRLALESLTDEDRRYAKTIMDYGLPYAAKKIHLSKCDAKKCFARITEALRNAGMENYFADGDGGDN